MSFASFRSPASTLGTALAFGLLFHGAAPGAPLYWDGADTTADADGGSGTWNTVATNWDDASTAGSDIAWTNGDDANFGGASGTVTLGEAALSAGTVTFDTTGYTLDTAGFDATWTTLAGSAGFTRTGTGNLTLSGASSATGTVTLSGGTTSLGNDAALGSTDIVLDGGTLSRNSTGTLANDLTVAGSSTLLGRTVVDNYLTLSGTVSGTGDLTVQGLVELTDATNTFSGALTLENSGAADPRTYLRLSASGVLGGTNDVTLSDTNSLLRLDGGVTQAIDELSGSGDVFAANVGSGLDARLIVGSNDGTSSYAGTFSNNDALLTLEKSGTGVLTLNRSGGNQGTLAGIEVSEGTLRLSGGGVGFNSGYFTGTTPITVGEDGTLEVTNSWNISSNNQITIDGGTLAFSAGSDGPNYMNNLTLENGATVSGAWRAGNATSAGVTTSGDSTNLISGNVFLVRSGTTVWTLDVADGASATDLNITGRVVDLGDLGSSPALRGTVVRKTGDGTLRLGNNNLWNGGLVISQGSVVTANSAALGDGTATLGDAGTGTSATSLLIENQTTLGNNLVVAADGTGTVTLGSTNSTSGNNRQFSGSLTLNRDVVLQAGASDRTTFAGQITGTGDILITSPFASGRRIVFERTAGPANDFVGDITLGSGAYLQIGVGNAIGNRTITDTATLHFTNAASSLRIAPANGSTDSETVGSLASLAAGAGMVDLFFGNGATSFTLAVGGDNEDAGFSGTITDSGSGQLSIEKVGTGTQTLSGASTYAGSTTVSAGTLLVNNTSGSGTGSGIVNVTSSGTLGGTGTIGGNTTVSGTLAPGASPGTLNFDNDLGLNSSATLDFELNPADMTAGGGINDLLAIGGALTLDGLLNVTATSGDFSSASLGDTWTLATYSGSLVDNGLDFGTMPTLANDYEWEVNTSTPGTVNLTVIPEPRFMLLGSLGLLLILRRRRTA